MKRFTTIEDQYIREHYDTHTLREMGNALSRSVGSVCGRMQRLGLVVPPDEQERRRRYTTLNLMVVGEKHRFKIGCEPINKGRPMSGAVYELAHPTMFKPGHIPANYKTLGSERVDKDGYVWMKVADPNYWMMKHRWLWEQQYGKLDNNKVVKFIDGDKNNITLSNLRLTDRQGNMIDNTIHNLPPELKQAVHSLGVMKRRINTISKRFKPQDNEQ